MRHFRHKVVRSDSVKQPKSTLVRPITLRNSLEKAPGALVLLWEQSEPFPTKEILLRLLTNPEMEDAWRRVGVEIDKQSMVRGGEAIQVRVEVRANQLRLWHAITSAYFASRKTFPSRKQKREAFLRQAEQAEALAKTISNGPLDLLVYEYFPAHFAEGMFNAKQWSRLESDRRRLSVDKKTKRSLMWPSVTDVILNIGQEARRLAQEALTEERFAVNQTADRHISFFLQHLARSFRKQFRVPMRGVLANIATVVFQKPITADFVKQVLRHQQIHF